MGSLSGEEEVEFFCSVAHNIFNIQHFERMKMAVDPFPSPALSKSQKRRAERKACKEKAKAAQEQQTADLIEMVHTAKVFSDRNFQASVDRR